jgi:hypothetical protein
LRRTIDGLGALIINQTTPCVSGIDRALAILHPVGIVYGPPFAKLIVFVITAGAAVPPLETGGGGLPNTFRLLL